MWQNVNNNLGAGWLFYHSPNYFSVLKSFIIKADLDCGVRENRFKSPPVLTNDLKLGWVFPTRYEDSWRSPKEIACSPVLSGCLVQADGPHPHEAGPDPPLS